MATMGFETSVEALVDYLGHKHQNPGKHRYHEQEGGSCPHWSGYPPPGPVLDWVVPWTDLQKGKDAEEKGAANGGACIGITHAGVTFFWA